jgi:hypothetical protein
MGWQDFALLFVCVLGACLLAAFIEGQWKSRQSSYYHGKAKPRGSNFHKH